MMWLWIAGYVAVWAVFFLWATGAAKQSKLVGHGGGFLVATLLIGILSAALNDEPPVPPPSPAEARAAQIKRLFSAWDGSQPQLVALVKASMHNPDSYQHAETKVQDMGDHLVVRMSYRGTNVYGGVVTNKLTAKVGLDGKVLDVLDQRP